MGSSLFALPALIFERIDVAWSFFLLITRFTAFLMTLPGLGAGAAGLTVRIPAIIAFSFTCLRPNQVAPLPEDMALMGLQVLAELVLGTFIGIIPLLVVSGAQAAGQIASGTMGLNGAQLFDPTTSTSVPDIARLYGDITCICFLMFGGHYVAFYLLGALADAIVPGTFLLNETTVSAFIDRSGRIFYVGIMIAAPVIVALLLTNFLLGLVTKAVPTVNILAVSFPLTVGIGLILSTLALPEVVFFIQREFSTLNSSWAALRVR